MDSFAPANISARAFRSADLFAGVILFGVTVYITSVAMSLAEHRLLAWQAWTWLIQVNAATIRKMDSCRT